MTEKPFRLFESELCDYWSINGKQNFDRTNLKELVDLLNELFDENGQLKSRIQYLENKIQRERNATHKQYAKWEQEAIKENEQLKEEIKDLNDVLARYEEKELENDC